MTDTENVVEMKPYWITFRDCKGKRTVVARRWGVRWFDWYWGSYLCNQSDIQEVEIYGKEQ